MVNPFRCKEDRVNTTKGLLLAKLTKSNNMEQSVKVIKQEIEIHKAEIRRHKSEIEKLGAALQILVGNGGSATHSADNEKKKPLHFNTLTFAQLMQHIFSDDVTKTGRQLYDEFLLITGKTNYKYPAFSARLSERAVVKLISRHEESDRPIHQRYIYGLKEWFNNDGLKEEYRKRIKFE